MPIKILAFAGGLLLAGVSTAAFAQTTPGYAPYGTPGGWYGYPTTTPYTYSAPAPEWNLGATTTNSGSSFPPGPNTRAGNPGNVTGSEAIYGKEFSRTPGAWQYGYGR